MASSSLSAAAPLPSALSNLISSTADTTDSRKDPFTHALTQQVLHNLQHQHLWTSLQIHTTSPLPPYAPLPRPVISGLPPRRLYIHPDEQIELLKEAKARWKAEKKDKRKEGEKSDKEKAEDKKEADAAAATALLDIKAEPEREWILPTRLNERWSVERLAGIFDGLGIVPPGEGGDNEKENKWRTTKRILMAIVDYDSTVVYYIVHDGIVKPRQN